MESINEIDDPSVAVLQQSTSQPPSPSRPSRVDFDRLDMNQIQRICSTGCLSDLTAQEQQYYFLMEKVRGLRARMRFNGRLVTKAGIIRLLKESDHLTDYQARRVYADAVNFFYDTDNVNPRAWANLYAERLENWANMLFTNGDVKEARQYLKLAAEMRGVFRDQEKEIPRELLDQKPTVIFTTQPGDLGVPAADRKQLEEFIDSIPEIPQAIRDSVKEDARIKTFDLKRRMLNDIKEFADNEDE